MSQPVSSLQAGEIIPQCGTTLDVVVVSIYDIWIGNRCIDADDPHVVSVREEPDDLLRVTLSLAAGDRLKVGDQ
jgi:hypothetical protein